MKTRLFGVLALATMIAAPALGADLPARVYTKAPPPPIMPAPVMTWTGCYIGGNGGVAWSHNNWFDPAAGRGEGSDNPTGGGGGGQVGCDYQTGNFVLGIQGMFDALSLDGSHPYRDDPRYIDHTRASSFTTVTGRLGYTWWPQTLLYVKGGGAWIGDKFTESCSPVVDTCPGEAKRTRSGWTFGVGGEYKFAPNWSAFIEYNFMDFGRNTTRLVYTDATTYDYRVKQEVNMVLFGLNYRFGGLPFVGGMGF
jgi:outer membrane immunogenic protein